MATKYQTPEQKEKAKKYRELRLWTQCFKALLQSGSTVKNARDDAHFAVQVINDKRQQLLGDEEDDEPEQDWPKLDPDYRA